MSLINPSSVSQAGLEFIVERVVGVFLVPGTAVLHGHDDAAVAVKRFQHRDVVVREAEVEDVQVLLDPRWTHRLGNDDDAALGLKINSILLILNSNLLNRHYDNSYNDVTCNYLQSGKLKV